MVRKKNVTTIEKIWVMICIGICSTGFFFAIMVGGCLINVHTYHEKDVISDFFLQSANIDLNKLFIRNEVGENTLTDYINLATDTCYFLDNICTSSFPYNGIFKDLSDYYKKKVLRCDFNNVVYSTWKISCDRACSEIETMNEYLNSIGALFYYIELPSVDRVKYMQEAEKDNKDVENWMVDFFIQRLNDEDINVLDLSDNEKLLNKYDVDNSGHWIPQVALMAANTIMNQTVTEYGYKKDEVLKIQYYNALDLVYKNCSYYLPVPIESPNYKVEIKPGEYSVESGFVGCFLKSYNHWDIDKNSDVAYYYLYTQGNNDLMIIKNQEKEVDINKSVLVLGDSFSWPIITYLSQEYKTIVALNPMYYDGSIMEIIKEYRPDVVYFMYVDKKILPDSIDEAFCISD